MALAPGALASAMVKVEVGVSPGTKFNVDDLAASPLGHMVINPPNKQADVKNM